MHALGIPSTRALAVVATGEPVYRDRVLPGAVLTRVAASHLRVGTFQYFAARDDVERLRLLAEHAIARHDPALVGAPDRHLGLLRAVAQRQARLVAQWMNVGFIHGVMNTDNMTISGETIDYGPCAFVEAHDPEVVFSSIDHHGRYAFGNQPRIAQWNLARLAETLLPLLDEDPEAAVARATAVIEAFPARFEAELLAGQRAKLGLHSAHADDATLAGDWLGLLQAQQIDHTLAWRHLAAVASGDTDPLRDLFADPAPLQVWLERWQARCAADRAGDRRPVTAADRAAAMRAVSPRIIPRNHRVEEALAAASDHDDLGPFQRLLAALRRPFGDDPADERYAEPAPREITERYRTFCGT
jgi:uncharacterized protein YdiU (UPF0061 family)